MGEFDFIRNYFAPLTASAPGAFNLTDDAAVLSANEYVVTKDVLIADVHFRAKDPVDLIARKALRVNISDIASMGAKPVGYLLGCIWPTTVKPAMIEQFASGLAEDQAAFNIALYGGDTTVHRKKGAPLTVSVTMFGTPPKSGVVRRSTAKLDDDLYVTGTIGDAGLGLKTLLREERFTTVDKASLAARYHLPEPRLRMGAAIAGLASAAIDVSDGLIADAGKLAAASGLRAEIDAVSIPRSTAAASWIARQDSRWRAFAAVATAGDDYELLFSAPKSMRRSVMMAAKASRTEVTRIGCLARGEGAVLLNENSVEVPITDTGYDHFAR